jgi:hypothetical protein
MVKSLVLLALALFLCLKLGVVVLAAAHCFRGKK